MPLDASSISFVAHCAAVGMSSRGDVLRFKDAAAASDFRQEMLEAIHSSKTVRGPQGDNCHNAPH